MMVLADLCRIIGVDQLHIGTVVGKMTGDAEEVEELGEEMERKRVKETSIRLAEDWGKMKPVFSVSSGGLHPGHVPAVIKHLGKDVIIQMGGGIHGHPQGTIAGANAARQAVQAVMEGKTLKQYAKTHEALAEVLKIWGQK